MTGTTSESGLHLPRYLREDARDLRTPVGYPGLPEHRAAGAAARRRSTCRTG